MSREAEALWGIILRAKAAYSAHIESARAGDLRASADTLAVIGESAVKLARIKLAERKRRDSTCVSETVDKIDPEVVLQFCKLIRLLSRICGICGGLSPPKEAETRTNATTAGCSGIYRHVTAPRARQEIPGIIINATKAQSVSRENEL